jgi:hypothetical protein
MRTPYAVSVKNIIKYISTPIIRNKMYARATKIEYKLKLGEE